MDYRSFSLTCSHDLLMHVYAVPKRVGFVLFFCFFALFLLSPFYRLILIVICVEVAFVTFFKVQTVYARSPYTE